MADQVEEAVARAATAPQDAAPYRAMSPKCARGMTDPTLTRSTTTSKVASNCSAQFDRPSWAWANIPEQTILKDIDAEIPNLMWNCTTGDHLVGLYRLLELIPRQPEHLRPGWLAQAGGQSTCHFHAQGEGASYRQGVVLAVATPGVVVWPSTI